MTRHTTTRPAPASLAGRVLAGLALAALTFGVPAFLAYANFDVYTQWIETDFDNQITTLDTGAVKNALDFLARDLLGYLQRQRSKLNDPVQPVEKLRTKEPGKLNRHFVACRFCIRV